MAITDNIFVSQTHKSIITIATTNKPSSLFNKVGPSWDGKPRFSLGFGVDLVWQLLMTDIFFVIWLQLIEIDKCVTLSHLQWFEIRTYLKKIFTSQKSI